MERQNQRQEKVKTGEEKEGEEMQEEVQQLHLVTGIVPATVPGEQILQQLKEERTKDIIQKKKAAGLLVDLSDPFLHWDRRFGNQEEIEALRKIPREILDCIDDFNNVFVYLQKEDWECVVAYMCSLGEIDRKAFRIAYKWQRSALDILRTNGYLDFKKDWIKNKTCERA